MKNLRNLLLTAACASIVTAAFQAYGQADLKPTSPMMPMHPMQEMHGPATMCVGGAFLYIYQDGHVYKLTTSNLRMVDDCDLRQAKRDYDFLSMKPPR
jgi:hypothetical protein